MHGVTLPTVDVWVKQGCPYLTRGSRGVEWEFDSAAVINWRRDKERQEAAGQGEEDADKLELRIKSAKAQMAELELLEARKLLAPVEEMERAWAKAFASLQVNVMNVVQRATLALLGETDETRFKTKLRAELAAALEQTASAPGGDGDDDEEDDED